MTNHTPGPWAKQDIVRHRSDGSTELVANEVMAGRKRVAEVDDPRDQAVIAAAPDMLAALKRVDGYLNFIFPSGPDRPEAADMAKLTDDIANMWRETRAAIARAEGREG